MNQEIYNKIAQLSEDHPFCLPNVFVCICYDNGISRAEVVEFFKNDEEFLGLLVD